MDLDDGKQLFDSRSDAEKVAQKMSRNKDAPFTVYKVGSKWAVGGVHTKAVQKKQKVKSLDEIKLLLKDFAEDESSIDDYITEIENEALEKESTIQGEVDEWILREVNLKFGCDIGMSATNKKTYLVLDLEKGKDKLMLKMGGNFSRHIPLIKRQADSLKNSSIVWHTWNSNTSNWGSDAWFYRIEAKDQDSNIEN
jgi:hypothetical protein